MDSGFEKLYKFDIDCDRLYEDWYATSSIILKLKNPYARTLVNQSSFSQGRDQLFLNTNSEFPLESFNASCIRREFAGTHTAEVVALVEQWFNDRNLRSTRIKYALLKPAERKGGDHTDTGYEWRYHLAVKTNPTVFMSVAGVKHPMTEPGTLYRMHAGILHWAGNLGPDNRLFLSFDVMPL
jgi:hypothetical protein